jgi:hypothetical protein
MNAPEKPPKKLVASPTGRLPDGDEIHDRVMKRYPIVMARLAEHERACEARRRDKAGKTD